MSGELSREALSGNRRFIYAVLGECVKEDDVRKAVDEAFDMAEKWRAYCEAGRVPPYSPEYLLEVAENTLIPVDPKKKAALFAVTDTFSKPDGCVRPPQVKLAAGDSATQSAESGAGRVSVPRERLEELLAEIQHQFSLREDYQERDHAIELVEAMLSAAPAPADQVDHWEGRQNDLARMNNERELEKYSALVATMGTGERTPADYAIEHGEYLATAAEDFQTAVNNYDSARDSEDDEEEERVSEARSDHWQSLSSAIHEFRKRAERAKAAPSPDAQVKHDDASGAR